MENWMTWIVDWRDRRRGARYDRARAGAIRRLRVAVQQAERELAHDARARV
jgi:hypothetical protein